MDVRWEEAGWERLTGRAGRRRLPVWDCTVGLVVGDESVLLIDPGSSVREGARVRAEAERLTGRSVTHIAFTHGHFDHVLGASAFAGVEVFGAVGLAGLLASGREELRADAVRHGLAEEEAAEAVDLLVLPGHPVSGEWTLELGGVQVLLANVGPGHTGHDLAVFVPGERETVFCGDLVEESGEPLAGPDAVPRQWPAALDRLLSLGGEDALYVPGHGAVVGAEFVRAQRATLAARSGVS
ncbi:MULTISPECIES: MBL fold metallo-hydrolase [Streptomyces]|uniref:MBL fold metallo-hydrolase n=1 Tax=Streptomyces TaxID=1883 RepID=UPI0004BD5288|nr:MULTISPECIES: MBL fold metallo-hydrolase [Streptomyces]KJY23235.1 metallo-beta-lactamase [Streptomyces sp. NRRL S-104]KOU29018.1 metallo-beta-lactamase [Streptomyces sp. WM6373]KOU68513.1 metallo-beta-lactamase [Streptomyces sp. IGB124]KOU69559.1 metallo-beta-lactamase [Streptomyces sp. XY66]KOU81582.1 metallo-beta-lactamase [Streptomyces sp. XY58]